MSIPFLSRAEVRAFDKHAIEQLGIPSIVLMENAGRGAAQVLQALGIRGKVAIACGKGNNGGDGLVLARQLAVWNCQPLVYLFADPDKLSPDCATQWRIVQNIHLPTYVWNHQLNEMRLSDEFNQADWIVDALFGTGLTGPLRAPFDRLATVLNSISVRKFAIDIPSGLDCDSGSPLGPTIRAEHTATFVAQKQGFANPASKEFTGRTHVIDIGVPTS